VARWSFQLVVAVRDMMLKGVFHRDLKPENIMLDQRGDLKVIDFGISKQVHPSQIDGVIQAEEKEARFTTQVGTLQWQAPEHFNGLGYTKRSEFFALAMNIIALITGKEPFDSAKNWINCIFPPRTDYKEFTFPWLVHPLIERCLKEDPMQRPNSINEIFDEISFTRFLTFQAVA